MFTFTPCILALVLTGLQQCLPTSADKQLMVCEKIDEDSTTYPAQISQTNCPGVLYNNVCYWLPFSSLKRGMFDTKTKALNYCAMFNGTLVDIESEQTYDALYLYLQMTWNYYIDDTDNNGVDLWLASIYQGGQFLSANGGPIYTYVRTEYTPHTSTSVVLTVKTRASRPQSQCGYYTPSTTDILGVPFCRL